MKYPACIKHLSNSTGQQTLTKSKKLNRRCRKTVIYTIPQSWSNVDKQKKYVFLDVIFKS